jgi:hypothetical protein
LSEDHDDEQHGFPHCRRTVHSLLKTDELDSMLVEESPQVREVEDTSCDPVELEADNGVDLSLGNVGSKLLINPKGN